MSTLQKAEFRFLEEVANRGGITVKEASLLQMHDPDINFGTGVDALDVIKKFLSLGYIKYQSATGKFVPADVGDHA